VLLVIDFEGMKKISLYFAFIVVSVSALTACEGREWDTDDELECLSTNWSYYYVSDVLDFMFETVDSTRNNDGRIITLTASINDTLNLEFHWKANNIDGDSVNVGSTLIQIGDSSIVKVDGYRYSDGLWAHLFTVDPGIINYEGKFHIDFFETGKTAPWGWSEIIYHKSDDEYNYRPYSCESPTIGRY